MNFLINLAFAVLVLTEVFANQFDPHVYPKEGPFFEGWYMRITDFDNKTSYGLLFGHVLPTYVQNSSDPKVLASLLYRTNCTIDNQCKLNSINVASSPNKLNVTVKDGPVVMNPDDASPSKFKWSAPFGYFMQDANVTKFQFVIGTYIFRMRIGPPKPWGPHGEGPEGWIDKLPFLPLHWFVFSLGSPLINLELIDLETGKHITRTRGVVHMEKNWGASFPKGWVWSQGFSPNSNVSFALSGGLVSVGPITTTQYLFGYRNPSKNLVLNFNPGNGLISAYHDGCVGLFKMTASGVYHEVRLNASALPSSFSDCLYGPENTGFRPACIESYDTVVDIRIYARKLFSLQEIDRQEVSLSALEFGGHYTCDKKCKG